jgi:hypothetical protein
VSKPISAQSQETPLDKFRELASKILDVPKKEADAIDKKERKPKAKKKLRRNPISSTIP